ncbi:MAG: MFS transporter [Eubacterium sp.]|nr:MFS transporter [Eubacterium sp.]
MANKLASSAGKLFTEIKTHWKQPAPGKYVPYREYADILIGSGSNYVASKTLEYLGFAASCYLMMYHYKLPYLTFSIIALINMPLNYIWTLMGWVINDNLGFLPKKKERKFNAVYLLLIAIGIGMIVGDVSQLFDQSGKFITYLNGLEGINATAAFKILGTHILWNGWAGARNIFWRKKLIPKFGRYKYSLYCDWIPKVVMVFVLGWLPFYTTITDVPTRVWVANLLFAIYNLFGFGNSLEVCAQNCSPNVRERIFVRTWPIKFSHFAQSILAILLPVFISFTKDKWADIAVFKYIIPFTFLISSSLTMVFAGRIKERIPQPPLQKKVGISFWDGMFGVMRNRYKWIQTIVGLLDSLGNGMLAFTTVLYLYTFRLDGLIYSLIVAIISFAGTPPDLFTPYFIKKFTYKQIMIFFQLSRAVCYTIVVLAYLFCGENLVLCGTICIIVLLITEMFQTVPKSVGHDMDVRVNDYQMYLSGERLESFSGVFGWFTGPITTFVGLIIPLLLLKFGFSSNWDVLFMDSTRVRIIVVPIIFDIVGYLLMTIPYFTWDYDDDKQNKVMQVLRRREEVTRKQLEAENGTPEDEAVSVAAEEKETAEVTS